MKQIYRFDRANPPCLNARLLQKEAGRRRLQRQALLLTVASVLSQTAVLLFGILLLPIQPMVTFACILYVLTAALSGGVVAVVLTKKGRGTVSYGIKN